jgi:hypothetical protein
MIKTNGLDSRDPDYDDFGFSDFIADYIPDDDVLIDWINDDTGTVLVAIAEYGEFSTKTMQAAWVDTHQDEIEDEWNARGEEE